MKTYFKYIFLGLALSLFLTGCEGDETFFGETIFNDDTNFPLVMIFDLNEDLEGITGNNFWGFELTAEDDGNQVRILFDSQDPNIVSHTVYVGEDPNDSSAPLETDVVLATITNFPEELVFTKEDIAAALGLAIEDLETGSVYFRGRSIDEDDNVVDDPSVFEDFLAFERHAYFYEWPLAQ